MTRQRISVSAVGMDGPALVAILDTLQDLHELIDQRFPAGRETRDEDAVVRLTEPATAPPEPEPEQLEPERPEPAPELPEPPPRAGRGSGLTAWQAYADQTSVTYPADATRDDIITACRDAGVIQ